MSELATTIGAVMQTKRGVVWSTRPSASVFEAIELMAEKEVGALVVMEDGELVGIVSERDYARKVVLQGRLSKYAIPDPNTLPHDLVVLDLD